MSREPPDFGDLRKKAEELRRMGRDIAVGDLEARIDEGTDLWSKLVESEKRVLTDIAPNLPRSVVEHVETQAALKKEELKALRAAQYMAELQPQLLQVLEELHEDQRRSQREQRRLNLWALFLSAVAATASVIQLIVSLWPVLSSIVAR